MAGDEHTQVQDAAHIYASSLGRSPVVASEVSLGTPHQLLYLALLMGFRNASSEADACSAKLV